MSLPKPYYQDDACTIYHADCRQILPELEAESVDLVLTDPPYFRVKSEDWDRAWKDAKRFLSWMGEQCGEWQRVLKVSGSLYVFAGHDLATQIEREIARRFHVLNRIRWTKEDGWHKKTAKSSLRAYLSPWEEIIFAEHRNAQGFLRRARVEAGLSSNEAGALFPSRTGGATGAVRNWELGTNAPSREQYELLSTLYPLPSYDNAIRPFNSGGPSTDIWDFPTVPPYPGKHPCEKPLSMLEYMTRVSSRSGALVLDPFMGSGSTVHAAKNLGRTSIGIEQDERWCEVAVRRLAQEVLPLEVS